MFPRPKAQETLCNAFPLADDLGDDNQDVEQTPSVVTSPPPPPFWR